MWLPKRTKGPVYENPSAVNMEYVKKQVFQHVALIFIWLIKLMFSLSIMDSF